MREITIEPESMEAALAWLDSADKEKRDAKLLKAKMADQSDYSVIQALQSLIAPFAMAASGFSRHHSWKREESVSVICFIPVLVSGSMASGSSTQQVSPILSMSLRLRMMRATLPYGCTRA
jgi:hypothetical protein